MAVNRYSASGGSGAFRRLEARPLARTRLRLTARGLLNLALLLVEVAAVLGVAWLVYSSYRHWRSLAAPLPAAAVTPGVAHSPHLPEDGLLPGAHQPPVDGGIPRHLRGLVQPMPALALPTPQAGRPSRIVIARIGVDAPVVEGDDAESLKMGVGHRLGTAGPGERGNMVLSGHNDVYGEIFRDLDKLDPGDRVIVYSGLETFEYVVRQKRIVEPTDLTPLRPSPVPIVTLISCYPYLVGTHRIVIVAELAD